jgi:superfamily II DNA or RNA helicase
MTEELVVEIQASQGLLRIVPPLPFLEQELTFARPEMPMTDRSFFDPIRQRRVSLKVRSRKVKVNYERLYFIGNDGAMYTHEGLLERITGLMSSMGIPVRFSRSGTPYVEPTITPGIARDLKAQQRECLASFLARTHAMAHAATAYGKTYLIAGLARAFKGSRGLVVTQRTTVVHSLHRRLTEMLAPDGIRPGIYMGEIKAPAELTVATMTLLEDFAPQDVQYLIFDEVHKAAADRVSRQVMRLNQCRKYGMSGTLGPRFDNKGLFLEAMFGPIVYEMLDQEAEDAEMICPVHTYIMDVPDGPEVTLYAQDYKRERLGIWLNPCRNRLIQRVCQRVPADQQVLVFVRTIEHLEHLKSEYLPDFEVFHSSLPVKQREDIQRRFETGELKRLISTDSLSEGVDAKNLYVLIDANWTTSETSVIQKSGRNRRFSEDDQKEFGVLIGFADEWNSFTARKARERNAHYRRRGHTIHEHAKPEDIQFVDRQAEEGDFSGEDH